MLPNFFLSVLLSLSFANFEFTLGLTVVAPLGKAIIALFNFIMCF